MMPSVRFPWLTGITLTAFALVVPTVAQAQAPNVDADAWQVFALEHAASEGVPASRLVADAEPTERVEMSWGFFAVVGHGHVVLVDTGTDALASPRRETLQRRWGVVRSVSVVEALARIGIAPGAVTDVILTHYHWDHSEGLIRFPNARVHVQQAEWPRVSGWVRNTVSDDRVRPFSRRTTVADSLLVRVAGAHTRNHVFVEVPCADRRVIIVGDAVYLPRNIDPGTAVAVTGNTERTVRDVAAAVSEVGANNVLAGHDPSLYARYPSGVEGVAAVCAPRTTEDVQP
ncbi:MAG: MBL fold metallo-hydrolase [Sandaracinaceae bacterium]